MKMLLIKLIFLIVSEATVTIDSAVVMATPTAAEIAEYQTLITRGIRLQI